MAEFRSVPNLIRTQLCRFRGCNRARCDYAHSLWDLIPPDERHALYPKAWAGGMDRWYGQRLTPRQVRTIQAYYRGRDRSEVPTWAHGVRWFYGDEFIDMEEMRFFSQLSWDFGLHRDHYALCAGRGGAGPGRHTCPVQGEPGLWEELRARRQNGTLGPAGPRRPPMPEREFRGGPDDEAGRPSRPGRGRRRSARGSPPARSTPRSRSGTAGGWTSSWSRP